MKLLNQTNIIYVTFLIILCILSTLKAGTPSNQPVASHLRASNMVKVGLTDIPEKENFSLEYFIKEKAYLKLMERDILPYLKRKKLKPPTCFISYAWGDRYHEYWVKRFCEMLHKAGIEVLLDRWSVRKGNNLNEFVKKIEKADWVVVVGTKLYLEKYNNRAANSKEKEDAARLEGQLIEYLVRYSTERGNRIVPILLEGTPEESLPFMLRQKISSEFTNNDYFEELLRLIRDLYNIDHRDQIFDEFIEKLQKYAIAAATNVTEGERQAYEQKRMEEIVALDSRISKEINVYKEEAFKLKGEVEEDKYIPVSTVFSKLHSYIGQEQLNNYVPRLSKQQELREKLNERGVCIVYGHGGVGKSTLVAEYGHLRKKERPVRWITAENKDKLIIGYENIAQELGINNKQLDKLRKNATNYLKELTRLIYNTLTDRQQPVLLILDNLFDPILIRDCLLHRTPWIEVIVTTRDKRGTSCYPQVGLDAFTFEEGKTYIQKRLHNLQPDEGDIQALIKEVGLIPQKLVLATGYIEVIKTMNVGRYIIKLQELKDRHRKAEGKLILPEATLGLETLYLYAQLVMRYSAYLDPDFIPLSLVSELLKISSEEKLDAILARLERLSLITIINCSNKVGIQIHQEIQAACKEYKAWKRGKKLSNQDILENLLKAVSQHMPRVNKVPDNTWDQARLYENSVTYVLKNVGREILNQEVTLKPLLAELFSRLSNYNNYVSCSYQRALEYNRQARKLYQELFSTVQPDMATCFNDLGSIYQNLGQYQRALEYYKKALEMRSELYKEAHQGNHPDIAYSLDSIGKIYKTLSQPAEALDYVIRALEMRRKLYKNSHKGNHPDLAESLDSVGKVYRVLGQFSEALAYVTQALKMRRKLYKNSHKGNHPDIAYSLDSVGRVYKALKQPKEALNHVKQALRMRKAIHKGNHSHTAYSLYSVGMVYEDLNKRQRAFKHYQQALEMFKALYPDGHPYINKVGKSLEQLK
ncbi:MAG: hypothetical protein BGO68_01530 [Candidatus Amoebophilus sp. 36-38]|nr:MAG: hypothetical protein BGO68_01530 [Candidatus Amoebophilus sp. 36-38]